MFENELNSAKKTWGNKYSEWYMIDWEGAYGRGVVFYPVVIDDETGEKCFKRGMCVFPINDPANVVAG